MYVCMYVCMYAYIAVSTRTLIPPTAGTDLTLKGTCWCKPRSQAVPPHVPSPRKAMDGQPKQPPRQQVVRLDSWAALSMVPGAWSVSCADLQSFGLIVKCKCKCK